MFRRMPAKPELSHSRSISLRPAREGDRSAIARLAALDSAPEPRGVILMAEVDGEAWAALSLEDGRAIADPFRRSGAVVELLRAAAAPVERRQGRPLLAPRWAA